MYILLTGLFVSFFSVFVISAPFSVQAGSMATLLSPEQCGRVPLSILRAWPLTDFEQCTVPITQVRSGGPGKDGIRSIEMPKFQPISSSDLADSEPVITVSFNGEARTYPLQILIWHEIVNDVVGGVPVAVTYCPLCNASIVFDRRLNGKTLEFGTTGNLRHSDLVMYDRQTESWFQQYDGTGLFGQLAGEMLTALPARLESVGAVRARGGDNLIMETPKGFLRPYGANPYVGYDSSIFPFLFDGEVPDGIRPLEYVVISGDSAWALDSLREKGRIETDELVLEWMPGRASALDSRKIADGRDLGIVTVSKKNPDGDPELAPYKISFAFVWHAFNPEAEIIR